MPRNLYCWCRFLQKKVAEWVQCSPVIMNSLLKNFAQFIHKNNFPAKLLLSLCKNSSDKTCSDISIPRLYLIRFFFSKQGGHFLGCNVWKKKHPDIRAKPVVHSGQRLCPSMHSDTVCSGHEKSWAGHTLDELDSVDNSWTLTHSQWSQPSSCIPKASHYVEDKCFQ